MSNILSLAPELMQAIASELAGKNFDSVKLPRLTCKSINANLEGYVLRSIVIDVNRHSLDAAVYQLNTLATKESAASRVARELYIVSLTPSRYHGIKQDDHDMEQEIERFLQPAIESFQNLQKITWINSQDPERVQNVIINSMKRLRSLKSLHLHLDQFTVNLFRWVEPDDSDRDETKPETLWNVLEEAKIFLDEINTNAITPSLFSYLSSYSGLQKLFLRDGYSDPLRIPELLARTLYGSALTKHIDTFTCIDVGTLYDNGWCFKHDNVAFISQCTKLTQLGACIPPTKEIADTLNLLLGTALTRPLLKTLTVEYCYPASSKPFFGTFTAIGSLQTVEEEIVKIIENYRPSPQVDKLPMVVLHRKFVGSKYYSFVAQRDENGVLGYKQKPDDKGKSDEEISDEEETTGQEEMSE